MRIGYVFTEIPDVAGAFPGAELEAMAARGLSIEIFVLRDQRRSSAEAERIAKRFVVHRSPYLRSWRLWADVLALSLRHPVLLARTLARTFLDARRSPRLLIRSMGILPKSIHFSAVARRRKLDLLHGYWASLPALAASVMARFADRPFTTWAHAGADIYQRGYQTDEALRSRLREARAVLTCHRANLSHFATLVSPAILEKVHLMTHGVDIDLLHPAQDGDGPAPAQGRPGAGPALLAIGKFVPGKGQRVLLEACRILKERGRAFECWLVGDGRQEAELHEYAVRAGIDPEARFLGTFTHEKIAALYRQADIFVMPSMIAPDGSRDGLPNVLLEAMASGLPCVGSDVASIPEVIEDGCTGLLVPPGDAGALASAIDRLIGDAGLRRELGARALARIREQYAREPAMDRLHRFFLTLPQEGPKRLRGHSPPE